MIPFVTVALADEQAVRRDAMLASMLEAPYPPSGAWRHEDFALAAYGLNQRTAEADRGLLTIAKDDFAGLLRGNDFHWHAYLLERIYFLFSSRSKHFPGRMGRAAEEALVDMLWRWAGPACRREMTLPERDWWVWGSENHHAQAWSGFWGAAQIFREHPQYRQRRYADGTRPADMARALDEYFQRYARRVACRGLLAECNSGYNKYTLGGWYNMADFASDRLLGERMRMLLDVYWADWAVEQIDGSRGGSRHRCYPGTNSTTGSSGDGLAWYHFGRGLAKSKHPSVMCAATSFYRPADCVAAMARDGAGRGEYACVSRRCGLAAPRPAGQTPNFVADQAHPFHVPQGVYTLDPGCGSLVRYTWCTPDFVLGTSMVPARPREEWAAISSQNRWEGVTFGGHPTARIFTQPLRPARGSVYNAHWSVQNRGLLIVQRLKASNARGQRVWFDKSLVRSERDGWVYAEAPRAWAAVRVVEGRTQWQADTVDQHHEGKGATDLGQWLNCESEFSPVIIEVVRKSALPTLTAFQEAIQAGKLEWQNGRLSYTSTAYRTTLSLPADYRGVPQVDGRPVNYEPQAGYESPFIRSDFGRGVVTLRHGGRERVLDFNRP